MTKGGADIRIATDKRGIRRAWKYGYRAYRWIPFPIGEADLLIAQDECNVIYGPNPMNYGVKFDHDRTTETPNGFKIMYTYKVEEA